jgi:hypothetical protein
VAVILAWALKRSAVARLRQAAAAETVGAEAMLGVQVEYAIPAEPMDECVFGTPVRSTRASMVAERLTVYREVVPLEIRVRVHSSGEDVEGVERRLGDLASAVASALTDAPLFGQGGFDLTSVAADPTALAPAPEPSVTANVSLIFTAQIATV